MKKKLFLLSVLCAIVASAWAANDSGASLKGSVTDSIDHEPMVGVTIFFPELNTGTTTDEMGNFSISGLPRKAVSVQVSYLGHKTLVETIDLRTTSRRNFTMAEASAELQSLVVTGLTGQTLMKNAPTPVSVVGTSALTGTFSTNIIDALSLQPGVSQITTGSGISKPVIRGLGYNRIVVVDDGIRQEGQQWGDEHGIEIDGQKVQSVEILKGPASLMYGSDAMAGALVFHSMPALAQGKMELNAATEYQTNNGLFDYTVNFAGNRSGLVWNWRWSDKHAHAYKNKYDGYVPGSQYAERALSGMLGLNRAWGQSHLILGYYHLTPGIVEGERDEEGELISEGDPKSYSKSLPFQQVHHYKAVLNNTFLLGESTLKAIVGYQQNRRQEFEETADEPGLDFRLHTINYTISDQFTALSWQWAAGIGGMWQRSENLGDEYLIPSYALFDIGAFATATRDFDRLHLSGGVRFDNRHLHSFRLEEDGEERFARLSRNFNGFTGSLGATYNLSEQMNLRLNIARGFRAPNLSELSSNGVHEGSLRYEIGNASLKPEFSWQADLGADYTSKNFSVQMALFANRISNYTFLRIANGEVLDDNQVYRYTQGDARLLGGELTVDFHPMERLHFENSLSYVDGKQTETDQYLPMMPPLRWTSELRYCIAHHGKRLLNNTDVSVEVEANFRQNHFLDDGSETATPAYMLVNLHAGTDIQRRGHKLFTVYLTANNLFDCAYQSHLSRLKYADINSTTGRRGVYNMGRNFGIKIVKSLNL